MTQYYLVVEWKTGRITPLASRYDTPLAAFNEALWMEEAHKNIAHISLAKEEAKEVTA